MDLGSVTGTFGAGSLSPKSQAKSGATSGDFYAPASSMFGDFNVQYGGIGGAGSADEINKSALIVGAVLGLVLWLRKQK